MEGSKNTGNTTNQCLSNLMSTCSLSSESDMHPYILNKFLPLERTIQRWKISKTKIYCPFFDEKVTLFPSTQNFELSSSFCLRKHTASLLDEKLAKTELEC